MNTMFGRILTILIAGGFTFIVVAIISSLVAKQLIISTARDKAASIISAAYEKHSPSTADDKVIAISTEIFNHFEAKQPANVPILRLRPYLTTERLPEFIRLPSGVIETIVETGLCDNAARMLAFVLSLEGYNSVQWNMIKDNSGHSALLVTLPDGRKIMADSFYGYVTVDEMKHLIHPNDARKLMQSGHPFDGVFMPLSKNSNPHFYQNFDTVNMGAEGEDLIIEATLPHIKEAILYLGKLDGRDSDVKSAAMKNNMTPYWQYMGHKYNREWVRILYIEQPVRIVMTLLEPVEEGILTATPEPVVAGKTLTWNLNAGEKITFRDGLAKISLKRMNSYIGVDQIAVYLLK
ncbi:MAG: hypothetical protein AB2801_09850 [Candidatus Thiodiazotropha endolucinida]